MISDYENSEDFARRMDADDELAGFRAEFAIPRHAGKPVIYFCGNSLGLMPRAARAAVDAELDAWESLAVGGHFKEKHPWYTYHEELRGPGGVIVGAQPSEVVYMNGLTVNLNLMLVSFFRPHAGRDKILIESGAFPSDLYAVQQHLRARGLDPEKHLIQAVARSSGKPVGDADIVEAIEKSGDEIALVLVGAINFYTGKLYDLEEITRAAHAAGAMVGFDLAHSAGNVTHELHDWNVDFAVWCTYKYLNSGPGAVSGCFVHEKHHADGDIPQFAGWWGNAPGTRFEMNKIREFVPVVSADRWQLSNPPILAMAPVRESLEIFARAGMDGLRAKSRKLTGYLEFLVGEIASDRLSILTPENSDERGAQLSLRVTPDAAVVFKELERSGVVGDLREPDVIRIAPTPLYNTFSEVYEFSRILSRCLGAASVD